jgi:hypothetical protein
MGREFSRECFISGFGFCLIAFSFGILGTDFAFFLSSGSEAYDAIISSSPSMLLFSVFSVVFFRSVLFSESYDGFGKRSVRYNKFFGTRIVLSN